MVRITMKNHCRNSSRIDDGLAVQHESEHCNSRRKEKFQLIVQIRGFRSIETARVDR